MKNIISNKNLELKVVPPSRRGDGWVLADTVPYLLIFDWYLPILNQYLHDYFLFKVGSFFLFASTIDLQKWWKMLFISSFVRVSIWDMFFYLQFTINILQIFCFNFSKWSNVLQWFINMPCYFLGACFLCTLLMS